MDYNSFLIFFVFIIVFITIVFTLVLSAIISIEILSYRSDDLLRYYIYDMRYSVFCACTYVSFFILFLYGLRIWNVNHVVDLRILYYAIISFFKLPLFVCIFIIILGLCIIINLFLYLLRLYKYSLHHIFILYLYFRYSPGTSDKVEYMFQRMAAPFSLDVISYFIDIHLYKLNVHLLNERKFNGLRWSSPYAKLPWYFLLYHLYKCVLKIIYNKYYNRFVTFSPIYVIIYDCTFNDFIISHVYYYLLVYIPIILWRRITKCLFTDASYVCELLCNIYYKKETCIYAILPNYRKVLDSYIMSGLRSNIDLGLEMEMYLKDTLCFMPDKDEYNGYRNFEALFIERKADGRFIQEKFDDSTEEWILLVDKHHFYTHKHKTLVFFN